MSCANGPMAVGRSKLAWNGTIHSGCTGTPSSATDPLPVTRWPMPSQSSSTVMPGAWRGTKAITLTSRPSWNCCIACVGIQCAKIAPVQ